MHAPASLRCWEAADTRARCSRADELFTTPGGSNDDWYWLYAAVTAGPEGKLITNDELRDHVFQMLPAPRLFYKWKERHQARAHSRHFCTAPAVSLGGLV